MATVIYAGQETEVGSAAASGGDLWVDVADLPTATGWRLEPQGVCAGEVCVPVPAESGWEAGGRFNVSALARHLNQAVAADAEHDVWVFAEAPSAAPVAPAGHLAPDFTLPDLDGRLHSLSDHRGHKVLLLSWASW
jgi:hypothetical protein